MEEGGEEEILTVEFKNPFNGIESETGGASTASLSPTLGIHSMELKV